MTANQRFIGGMFWVLAAAAIFFAVETTHVHSPAASWLYLKLFAGCLTAAWWMHDVRFGKPMPKVERWSYRFAAVFLNVLLWLIAW